MMNPQAAPNSKPLTASSRATYVLPVLLFCVVSFLIAIDILGGSSESVLYIFDIGLTPFLPLLGLMVALSAGLYFLFRFLAGKLERTTLQVLAFFLPAILQIIVDLIFFGALSLNLVYLVEGMLLLWLFNLLSNRYDASLTADALELENLLGQTLSIPLGSITKLEQKRAFLAFFREFSFLNASKKTAITFCDENLDEFEVNIFPRVYASNNIFDGIVSRARYCGNENIRQYKA